MRSICHIPHRIGNKLPSIIYVWASLDLIGEGFLSTKQTISIWYDKKQLLVLLKLVKKDDKDWQKKKMFFNWYNLKFCDLLR